MVFNKIKILTEKFQQIQENTAPTKKLCRNGGRPFWRVREWTKTDTV